MYRRCVIALLTNQSPPWLYLAQVTVTVSHRLLLLWYHIAINRNTNTVWSVAMTVLTETWPVDPGAVQCNWSNLCHCKGQCPSDCCKRTCLKKIQRINMLLTISYKQWHMSLKSSQPYVGLTGLAMVFHQWGLGIALAQWFLVCSKQKPPLKKKKILLLFFWNFFLPYVTKTLHLETKYTKTTKYLPMHYDPSECVCKRERRESLPGYERVALVRVCMCSGLWDIWFYNPCKVEEASIEELSHPQRLISWPLTHLWKESFTCIKAPAPSSNSVYSSFFSLSLTSSPCFLWYQAPWNLHSFQIKCEWRVCFLRIAWHDGWNPIVNITLELTVSLRL